MCAADPANARACFYARKRIFDQKSGDYNNGIINIRLFRMIVRNLTKKINK